MKRKRFWRFLEKFMVSNFFSLHAIKSSFWTLLGTVGRVVFNLMAIPLSVAYLGQELYGIWTTLWVISGVAALWDLGLSGIIRNLLTERYEQYGLDAFSAVFTTSLVFFVALCVLIIASFGLVAYMFPIEQWIFQKISFQNIQVVKKLFVLFGFLMAFNLALGIVDSMCATLRMFDELKKWDAIFIVVGFIFLWIIIKADLGVYMLAASTFLPNFLCRMWMLVKILWKYELKMTFDADVAKLFFQKIKIHGAGFMLTQGGFLFGAILPSFWVARLFGPHASAEFSVVYRVVNIPLTFLQSLIPMYWSEFVRVRCQSVSLLYKKFFLFFKVSFGIFGLGSLSLLLLGPLLFKLWLQNALQVPYFLIAYLSFWMLVQSGVYWLSTYLNTLSKLYFQTLVLWLGHCCVFFPAILYSRTLTFSSFIQLWFWVSLGQLGVLFFYVRKFSRL